MSLNLKAIAEQFGLSYKEMSRANNAVLSQVYVIDNAFVLRSRALQTDTEAKFKKEQSLLDLVRSRTDLKFPNLLNALDGHTYTIQDNLLWTAYPLIEGDVPCTWFNLDLFSAKARESSYRTLSKLHSATKGALSSIPFESTFLHDIEHWMKETPGTLLSSNSRERLNVAMTAVRAAEALYTEDDLCFVHGDYHAGNIVLKNDKVIGLLDTDWSRKGSPLEDLSYTLMTHSRDYKEPTYRHNQEAFDLALQQYGLAEDQLKLFKEYMLLATFYDLHLLSTLNELKDKPYLVPFQVSFLEDLVNRYQ